MMGRRKDFRLYRERRSAGKRVGAIVLVLLLVFLTYQGITSFVIKAISVTSISMTPGIVPNDRLFVSPLAFGASIPFGSVRLSPIRAPSRGELVVVRPPYYTTTGLRRIASPLVAFFTVQKVQIEPPREVVWEQSSLIRRVIATPGDTVRIDGFVAWVRPAHADRFENEQTFSRREYPIFFDPLPSGWNESLPVSGSMTEITLGEDEYFLLSDNRSVTNDSRYWGPLGIASFTGRVLLRYWPLGSFGVPR